MLKKAIRNFQSNRIFRIGGVNIVLYEDENYRIVKVSEKNRNTFILGSKHKRELHGHFESYNLAFKTLNIVTIKKIPNSISLYALVGIKRVTDDEELIQKVDNLIKQKCNRKNQFYFNSQKGKV
jgi:hypothetical protein